MHDLPSKSSLLTLLLFAALVGACHGSGSDAVGGGGGSGGGAPCGNADGQCPADQFCDGSMNWCGEYHGDSDSSVCRARDAECDASLQVCGCDGKVYDSECAAHLAGVDIGGAEAGHELCAHELTPQGTFACGPFFCPAATSYCDYGEGDQGDRATECKPLPAACNGVGTCDCVPLVDTEGGCQAVEGNGVAGVLIDTPWQHRR